MYHLYPPVIDPILTPYQHSGISHNQPKLSWMNVPNKNEKKITLTFSLPGPELSCGLMLSFCPSFPASDFIVCLMSFRDCILPEMFISGSFTDGRDLLSPSFPVSAK